MERRTRIVATLGPATDPPEVLESILELGLDVARINFSHGAFEDHRRRVTQVRELAARRSRPVAVLGDLPGPKLRAVLDQPLPLEQGQQLTLSRRKDGGGDFGLTEPEMLDQIAAGQRVLLDDGRLQCRVVSVAGERVSLQVEVGGTLRPNKGVNLPDTRMQIPTITERDRHALQMAADLGVDWLALSFVRAPYAADELRACARARGLSAPVIAKIERPEALDCADELIAAFDGIMVARGDLGVEIPLEQVPHVQKQLINDTRAAGKPVITATDMLDSIRHNPRPTRAEAGDVANAIYDGTDAVMLSGETAVGGYPVEAVMCMDRIARETEKHIGEDHWRKVAVPRGNISDHITHLTCQLAWEVHADAIIAPTNSGHTPRMVARHRPNVEIIAPTADEMVCRQLALSWGMTPVPFQFELKPGADRLAAAVKTAHQAGAIRAGARVIVLAGHPLENGEGLPTIRVVRIGEQGQSLEP